jgi:hypothetical protein
MPDNKGMSQTTAHGWVTGDQHTFMGRLGSWFRKSSTAQEVAPTTEETDVTSTFLGGGGDNNDQGGRDLEPRTTFLRPWAKRENAIDGLQRGVSALSDLLTSLRDNMERQSQRQEELLGHLASLPEALRAIPEASRTQSEALQAIHTQMERQAGQTEKLSEVLDKMTEADGQQAQTMQAIQRTFASLGDHEQVISQNMQSLGTALESMSGNSHASANVLEKLRDNTARRDGELERVIKRQNIRFTTMLTVAIVLSVAALTAVSVFGYLAYDALTKIK